MIRTPTVNPGWYGRLTRQLGDDVQIDDDFASAQMTLTHDHNGNLTGGMGVPPVNSATTARSTTTLRAGR